jgi:hypothetical protein
VVGTGSYVDDVPGGTKQPRPGKKPSKKTPSTRTKAQRQTSSASGQGSPERYPAGVRAGTDNWGHEREDAEWRTHPDNINYPNKWQLNECVRSHRAAQNLKEVVFNKSATIFGAPELADAIAEAEGAPGSVTTSEVNRMLNGRRLISDAWKERIDAALPGQSWWPSDPEVKAALAEAWEQVTTDRGRRQRAADAEREAATRDAEALGRQPEVMDDDFLDRVPALASTALETAAASAYRTAGGTGEPAVEVNFRDADYERKPLHERDRVLGCIVPEEDDVWVDVWVDRAWLAAIEDGMPLLIDDTFIVKVDRRDRKTKSVTSVLAVRPVITSPEHARTAWGFAIDRADVTVDDDGEQHLRWGIEDDAFAAEAHARLIKRDR